MSSLTIVCFFTFLIHLTESLTYGFRLAGLRTRQLAIALSFVTSTLLISRLSNMFQAPLLGAMVDHTIALNDPVATSSLDQQFRIVILMAFVGSLLGSLLTPTAIDVYKRAITRFLSTGSLPRTAMRAFQPRLLLELTTSARFPIKNTLSSISIHNLPKGFLVMNIFVTAIYTIGVLCSLSAGAHMPELRSTAIQLSGIVNGIATILLTLFVDPSGARITDQAYNKKRPEADVKSVVFFLLAGRLIGTLFIAQLLFSPFSHYIMWVTKWIAQIT